MKKFCILFFHFLLFISVCKSQQSQYEYGFQGGLVLGNASGSAVIPTSKTQSNGLGIGFHAKRNFSPHFALKVKINYEQMGWAYKDLVIESPSPTNPLTRADFIYRLPYVNMPILAEYRFGKKMQVYLNGGPFLGFLIDSKTILRYKELDIKDVTSTNNNFRFFNAGISTGLGLSYPLSPNIRVNLEGNQQFGLVNVADFPFSSGKVRLNSFSIMTGLCFSF